MYFPYGVIKEVKSIFWEVIAWVMARKNSSYEHMSNSEMLPASSCLNLHTHFWLRGWKKWEVSKRKVGTPDGLFAHILDAAASIKKREDQLRRTTRHLRTGVAKCIEVDRVAVTIIYSQLSKICHLCVTNLSFKQTEIKIKLTGSNFSFFIHKVFVCADSSSSISVTIQN